MVKIGVFEGESEHKNNTNIFDLSSSEDIERQPIPIEIILSSSGSGSTISEMIVAKNLEDDSDLTIEYKSQEESLDVNAAGVGGIIYDNETSTEEELVSIEEEEDYLSYRNNIAQKATVLGNELYYLFVSSDNYKKENSAEYLENRNKVVKKIYDFNQIINDHANQTKYQSDCFYNDDKVEFNKYLSDIDFSYKQFIKGEKTYSPEEFISKLDEILAMNDSSNLSYKLKLLARQQFPLFVKNIDENTGIVTLNDLLVEKLGQDFKLDITILNYDRNNEIFPKLNVSLEINKSFSVTESPSNLNYTNRAIMALSALSLVATGVLAGVYLSDDEPSNGVLYAGIGTAATTIISGGVAICNYCCLANETENQVGVQRV